MSSHAISSLLRSTSSPPSISGCACIPESPGSPEALAVQLIPVTTEEFEAGFKASRSDTSLTSGSGGKSDVVIGGFFGKPFAC
jgi:hypothetical protein